MPHLDDKKGLEISELFSIPQHKFHMIPGVW